LFVRLVYLLVSFPKAVYGDAPLYVSTGESYVVNGTLPNALNPGHPPLGKYIIGFFAVYAGEPAASSLLFGVIVAISLFLIVRELAGNARWGVVAVWLFAFSLTGIGISVYPVLDVFMLAFSMLGLYMLLRVRRLIDFVLVGVLFGLALASKESAILFILPVIAWLLVTKRPKESLLLVLSGIAAYVSSYLALIIREGFGSFASLLAVQFGLKYSHRGAQDFVSLFATIQDLLNGILFQLSTYTQVAGVTTTGHPEAFTLFGYSHISLANEVNPWIMLSFFPVLVFLVRAWKSDHDRRLLLIIFILTSNLIGEGLLNYEFEPWLYASMAVSLSIAIPVTLKGLWNGTEKRRALTFLYLAQVAIWLVVAPALSLII
jgi:predicted membrane-bound dolichyl-phosphate-mannose-protein mannosyltransferase